MYNEVQPVNLAVDAGRSEVEAKPSTGKLVAFPSAVSKAGNQKNPQLLKDDLEIELDGQKWWVGDLAQREGKRFKVNNFGDSKASPVLKVQVIASVILTGLVSRTVNLGVLVPIDSYTKEERKAIRELLKGTHHFRYWHVEKPGELPVERAGYVTITDKILIAQECVAAYWSSPQDETTQTIDFGAQTINYGFHRHDRVYINDNSGTIPEGWEILKEKHGLRGIPDEELDEKECMLIAEELVSKLVDEVKLKGWSPRYKTQVFGGIAPIVFQLVMKHFPKATISANPRNGNVEGLAKLLERVHSNVS